SLKPVFSLPISKRCLFASNEFCPVGLSINDIHRVNYLRASAIVKTSNPVPRQKATAASNEPQGKAVRTILCCGVDSIRKAKRTGIELMNDGVLDVIAHHCGMHPIFHTLIACWQRTEGAILH